jgi:hypothetical protein
MFTATREQSRVQISENYVRVIRSDRPDRLSCDLAASPEFLEGCQIGLALHARL